MKNCLGGALTPANRDLKYFKFKVGFGFNRVDRFLSQCVWYIYIFYSAVYWLILQQQMWSHAKMQFFDTLYDIWSGLAAGSQPAS